MRPLFTVHAGEFLVGQHIEQGGKNVWVPTKDTGVDLLVTDKANTKAVALQVKFSRDFLPIIKMDPAVLKRLVSRTWFTVNEKKLDKSGAHYWIFVLLGFEKHTCDYLIIEPQLLLKRLKQIHGKLQPHQQMYVCVTDEKKAWLTRGLSLADYEKIANGSFRDDNRDVTQHVNDWKTALQDL